MYKVMLVDDDYPVLEYMADAIDWHGLGLQLQGMHENGASALEAAMDDMPDIVITDIGMPRMDGLELLSRLKERNPALRAAVLSCHSEFHYAQRALKLQVHDYLVKDTLDPAELSRLLQGFSTSLAEEEELRNRQQHMRRTVDRSVTHMKERFIRATVEQPMLDAGKWVDELASFGLQWGQNELIYGTVCAIDDYSKTKRRFQTEDMLCFALDNALGEAIGRYNSGARHFVYSSRYFVLLQTFPSGLKVNGSGEMKALLQSLQDLLQRFLKLSFSYMASNGCRRAEDLKHSLHDMLLNYSAWFYRSPQSALQHSAAPGARSRPTEETSSMLLAAEVQEELRQRLEPYGSELTSLMLGRSESAVRPIIERWAAAAGTGRYAPDAIKDWVLKLLLDTKQKLQSLQNYRTAQLLDAIHQDVYELDTMTELKEWFAKRCESIIDGAAFSPSRSSRAEIAKAQQYVLAHLDKKMSLEEVAELLFMNPSYFSRLYKKETGETFIEYVTRIKMSQASELLADTGATIGQICERLGYDNQSYFIKLFKAYAGMTPIEYRAQSKRG